MIAHTRMMVPSARMARLDRALGTTSRAHWRRILAERRLTEASLRLD